MKNKTQKSIISTLLVLVLVVGCFAALPLMTSAAPAPVPGNPGWKAEYSASANKGTPTPILWDRGSADGDKIPSNAHSADYPGLYFYWDDKQKEDGVLLVNESVFDYFQDGYTYTLPNVDKKQAASEVVFAKGDPGFVLTAKNSNNYWGYKIAKSTGKVIDTVNGEKIYAYAIPKQIQFINPNNGKNDKEDLKNINMVFIDGKYKSGFFEIVKNWYDEEGTRVTDDGVIDELNAQLKFNNKYALGINEVKISDYITAVKGAKVTVTETVPEGYLAQNGQVSKTITVKYNDAPVQVVEFHNQKQYAYISIIKIWDLLPGTVIGQPAKFNIYNAAGALLYAEVGFGDYQVKSGEGPFKVVELPITGFTSVGGYERVNIGVEAGDKAYVTFTNEQIPPAGGIGLRKTVDGIEFSAWAKDLSDAEIAEIVDDITFELRQVSVTKVVSPYISAEGKLGSDGIVTFDPFDFNDDIEKRRDIGDNSVLYAVTERLDGKAKAIFEEIDTVFFAYHEGKAVDPMFDYNALYTIVNGYGNGGYYISTLNYPGLNNDGDIFYIGVTNTNNGAEFVSFCANAGSVSFSVHGGYMKAESLKEDDWLSAFNYIEDKYGDLNKNRPITQTVVWAILGAVDVNSVAFDATFLSVADKAAVRDVMANSTGYKGDKIADVVYMKCAHPDCNDVITCQPQIVPIYAPSIDNKQKEYSCDLYITKSVMTADGLVFGEDFEFIIINTDNVRQNDKDGVDSWFTDSHGVAHVEFDVPLPEGTYYVREIVDTSIWKNQPDAMFTVDADGVIAFEKDGSNRCEFINEPVALEYAFRIVTSTESAKAADSYNLGKEVNEPFGADAADVKAIWYGNLITFDVDADKDAILAAMQAIVDNANAGTLTWTWDPNIVNNGPTATNTDGQKWTTLYDVNFYVGDVIVDGSGWIYFAADDAVIVQVNGQVAAWSINVLGEGVPDLDNPDIQYPLKGFQTGLGRPGFTLYACDLSSYLSKGENTITIIALNQNVPPNEPRSDATSEGNPAGILLAFEVISYNEFI